MASAKDALDSIKAGIGGLASRAKLRNKANKRAEWNAKKGEVHQRRDVRGDHRAADDPPGELSARKKIVVALFFFARGHHADSGHDREIDEEHD